MMRLPARIFGLALGWSLGAASAASLTYTVQDLGLPQSAYGAYAKGANESGTVVGGLSPRSGAATVPAKFIHGRTINLTGRAGVDTTGGMASAINAHGVIVGKVLSHDHPDGQLMISQGRDLTLVSPPGRGPLEVHGVNDHGLVVGTARTAEGDCRCAFLYHPDSGTFEFLRGPDNHPDGEGRAVDRHGQVYGLARQHGVYRAAVWRGGEVSGLPDLGGTYSFASAVNHRGDVAGASLSPTSTLYRHVMLIRDGVAVDLDGDATRQSEPAALNDAGVVVGTVNTPGVEPYGFVSYDGGRLIDLNRRLTASDKALWYVTATAGVDSQGRIYATARTRGKTSESHAVVLTPTPSGR